MFVLQVTAKTSINFYILACAEIFQACYGGTITEQPNTTLDD
jgi:hypothetical protein